MKNSTPHWFDSHCHFDFSQFDGTLPPLDNTLPTASNANPAMADTGSRLSLRQALWQRAHQAGVTGLLIPGITLAQSTHLVDFCAGYPWCYAQGIHPYFLPSMADAEAQLDALAQLLSRSDALAVGEIGLDWPLAQQSQAPAQHQQQQWHLFEAQVALAQAQRLPLIVHIRGAHDEAAAYLRRCHFRGGGIVHAFSGSLQQAHRWLELGFKLGIGGAMTFPRAQKLRRTLRALPQTALLLETDAPDMRPAFLRGQNSPLMIPLYGYFLAALRGEEVLELAAALANNLKQALPGLAIE